MTEAPKFQSPNIIHIGPTPPEEAKILRDEQDALFSLGRIVLAGGTTSIVQLDYDSDRVLKIMEDSRWEVNYDREAKVYERLGPHPNILGYYGRDPDGSLVLEHAKNRDVRTFWRFYNAPPVHIRFKWCLGVARAVAHIHSRGVVHGDLGARNIVVTDDLVAKLCDFGGSSVDGEALLCWGGLPYYCCNWNDDPVVFTPSDDLFALGYVLLSFMTVEDFPADFKGTSRRLPDTAKLDDARMRRIIVNCCDGTYTTSESVVEALEYLELASLEEPLVGHKPEDDGYETRYAFY